MKPIFALLLLAGAAAAQPTPKPPPGKAEPVDYEAELNDKLSKGITPATNANVLLWKALGPKPEGRPMPPVYFKRLGIPEPPEQGEYMVGTYRYITDYLKLDQRQFDGFNDEYSRATRRPWRAADFPRTATWLKLNEKPLAVVAEAVKRPDYYNPLVTPRKDNVPGVLIGVWLPNVQKCREVGAAFAARAMLRVGEGKLDAAWQDLLAGHRLARLVGRGGALIEGLVGLAVENTVGMAELAYLDRANLTSAQARDRLKELQSLPPMGSIADKIDLAERYIYLDSLQHLNRGGVATLKLLSGEGLAGAGRNPTPEEQKALDALAAIDWGPAIKHGNQWYDRLAAAIRKPTRAERSQEIGKIEADLKALQPDAAKTRPVLKDLLRGKDPGAKVGQAIGNVLIIMLTPAARKMQDSHDRAEQWRRNVFVAFALAAYRADHGRYPAKLDELAPKYLPAVPGDLFSGKPLIYRPEENGYLLYSVGENGKEDGGRWFNDDPRGDDPRVRMPLPPPKPRK